MRLTAYSTYFFIAPLGNARSTTVANTINMTISCVHARKIGISASRPFLLWLWSTNRQYGIARANDDGNKNKHHDPHCYQRTAYYYQYVRQAIEHLN